MLSLGFCVWAALQLECVSRLVRRVQAGTGRHASTQAQGRQARDLRAEAVFCGCSPVI